MSKTPKSVAPILVGVGASAGGLEAFQRLLKGLPDDHDLVLILVQHLDPDHDSLMPELVRSKTASPVHSITDNMTIEAGHIYLLPPGYELGIEGATLKLIAFEEPRGLRRPIDHFFKSLAQAHKDNAIAVVLSGTGSDGAEGAREIKGEGGLVFVQTPDQAKYDGMPRSVIDQGTADVVLDAEEIVDVVKDYFALRTDDGIEADDDAYGRIIRQLRFRTGYDFSEYKDATIRRRVAVRMSVLNCATPGEYLAYLVAHKDEADLLFRDLLINVTSFFRDPEHYDALAADVIPRLVEEAEPDSDLRIWVAGCSTGEEAYSIAMLVAEEVKRVSKKVGVVVFGTDIDEQALNAARTGIYSDAISEAVPADLLAQYFSPVANGYEISKELRGIVRFSRHSFVKDPPFSKLDLVSCRNVLIYFKDSLQEVAMQVFHHGLRDGGHLFLGPSENPRGIKTLFEETSMRSRLFRRRPGASKPLYLGRMAQPGAVPSMPDPEATEPHPRAIDRLVLENYAPAYLHVDEHRDVLFASPQATRFLALRSGVISVKLFDTIAPELEPALRQLSRKTLDVGEAAEVDFQGEINGRTERVVVIVRQLADGSQLIVLRDRLDLLEDRPEVGITAGSEPDQYVATLERDLEEARQEVRTTVEELETSNEELKSSNEEMMSMNEELQSANEELTTINDELQQKLRDLHQANTDLANFIQSSRIPTVFLDDAFRVLRYTPEAENYFRFSEADLGRPLEDLNSELDHARLLELCESVITAQQETVEEFATDEGKALSVRIMPYSPDGLDQRGVVFTILDVTELRTAVKAADEARAQAEARAEEVRQIYETSPLAMGLISRDMVYLRLNEQLARLNGLSRTDHVGRTVRDVLPSAAEVIEANVRQVFETGQPVIDQEISGTTRDDPDKQHIWLFDFLPFFSDGRLTAVSTNVREITEHVETANNLRQIMRELEHRVKNMLSNVNSLINRASRDATTDRAVFETLQRRIRALSQTHSLLTAEKWSSATLRSIVEPETIDVYGEERVTIKGPDLRVTSEAALALGMAVHELATNATKYGAFSVPEGYVTITWSRINDADSDRLVLTWTERGGPPVEKPERTGFGSQLITSTLEGSLEGSISRIWEPEGLTMSIAIEYALIAAPMEDPVNV
ncbi:CheR family methyltransferase [Thalassorhabdomicrobium marinisediminis]|uniref:Chemotaxis protein CheR n=1 Tax=Thalassorhabdomicrobium marinisediminis TaxID=2170577 RepID=A0A2T7FUN9_9RHOB|nr:CheR family methyltransferase [Thalassorhabdomicrobium marinisediminis]PVA05876.1 chemotaxis protein CheR [Thalassorhabdomicrobium marinisediminis]